MSTGLWPSGPTTTGPMRPAMTQHGDLLNYQPASIGGGLVSNADAAKIIDRYQTLSAFFGHPNKNPDIDPHALYDIEHEHLPKAFEGRNTALTELLIDEVRRSDMYMITELFPLKLEESSMTVSWKTIKFVKARLNRQPEEMVPRMMVYNTESGQESLVRFGIGLMMEHGFFRTEKGVRTYVMHLKQMSYAIAAGMAEGAAIAALEHPPYRDSNDIYRQSGPRSYDKLCDLFRKEIQNFAPVNKFRNGMHRVEDQLRETMENRNSGRDGDYVVYPRGLMKLSQWSDAETIYALSGKRAPTGPLPADGMAQTFRGKTKRESKAYGAGHEVPQDPFFRSQTIGNYFHMVNYHLQDVEPAHYRTKMMDTFIFSRRLNNWARISYEDAIKNGGLWKWDTPGRQWTALGQDFFQGERAKNSFGDKKFDSWGEFADHIGMMKTLVRHILDWKNPQRGDEGHRKLTDFIRKFDPELKSINGKNSVGEYRDEEVFIEEKKHKEQPGRRPTFNRSTNDYPLEIDGDVRHPHHHHRDTNGRYVDNEHHYAHGGGRHARSAKSGRYVGPDASMDVVSAPGQSAPNVEVPPNDIEKIVRIVNDREAAVSRSNPAEEAAVKISYQQLREFLRKLSEREADPLATHYVQRKFSIMDEHSPVRFALDAAKAPVSEKDKHPQLRLAQYAYHFLKTAPENAAVFSSVFFLLQPGLYELDMDMSLEYISKHPLATGGLTPYEQLLTSESNRGQGESTKEKFREANNQSPSFSLDFRSGPGASRQGGLLLPITVGRRDVEPFHIVRERDSEAMALVAHFLPLFHVSNESVKHVLNSATQRAGALILFSGKTEPHRKLIARAQFSSSISLVYGFVRGAVEQFVARLQEAKVSGSGSGSGAGGRKSKGSQEEKKEEALAYVDLEPDFDEMARSIHSLVCLEPSASIDSYAYRELLEQERIFDAAPLALQYQLRHVIKKLREAVWFVVNDHKRSLSTTAVHAKNLFHIIKYTMSYSSDQQVPTAEAAPAPGAGRPRVGMDLAFRLQEFSGEFNESQLEEFHTQAHAVIKAIKIQELAAAGTSEEKKRQVEKAFKSAQEGGWLQFFSSLYIIVTQTKENRHDISDEKRKERFDLLVRTFLALLVNSPPAGETLHSKDAAISYYFSAATAYPLGPLESFVGTAEAKPTQAERIDFLVGRIYAYSKAHKDAKAASVGARSIDNRYFSVDREASSITELSKPGNRNLYDIAIATSYGFKPFLQSYFRSHDVNTELKALSTERKIGLVWEEFSSNLPQALHEFGLKGSGAKASVAYALYAGVLGKDNATEVFGDEAATVSEKDLKAQSLKAGGLIEGLDTLSNRYEQAARSITGRQVQSILYSLSPSSGDFAAFCLEENLPFLLGAIGWRPHNSFLMSTLLYANRGAAGMTHYGFCDFQVSDDTQRKMHFGNYTQYHRTIIPYKRYLCLYRNIAVHDYLGGDGHEFWNPQDPYHKQQYQRNQIFRDIFITLVPVTHKPDQVQFMDMTGFFSESLGVDSDCNAKTQYFSSKAYVKHWKWRHLDGTYNAREGVSSAKQPRGNTLCFQTAQYLYVYNPGMKAEGVATPYGMGNFTQRITDAGHWGDRNIYPGCMDVIYGSTQTFDSAVPSLNVKSVN